MMNTENVHLKKESKLEAAHYCKVNTAALLRHKLQK